MSGNIFFDYPWSIKTRRKVIIIFLYTFVTSFRLNLLRKERNMHFVQVDCTRARLSSSVATLLNSATITGFIGDK